MPAFLHIINITGLISECMLNVVIEITEVMQWLIICRETDIFYSSGREIFSLSARPLLLWDPFQWVQGLFVPGIRPLEY
jgi:hypothetical protein